MSNLPSMRWEAAETCRQAKTKLISVKTVENFPQLTKVEMLKSLTIVFLNLFFSPLYNEVRQNADGAITGISNIQR